MGVAMFIGATTVETVNIEAGRAESRVTNEDAEGLLQAIVTELQKANLHLTFVSDIDIQNKDVEG
jgi:hypothetical protein